MFEFNSSAFLSHLHHQYALSDGTYSWPNSRDGDMLRQAKFEIEMLHAKLKTIDKELELARKIHWLIKTDHIFLGGFIIDESETPAQECMAILCNDVFVPAADCERLYEHELDDYIAFVKKYPRAGSQAWVANKRGLDKVWRPDKSDWQYEFEIALKELQNYNNEN
jgi:hypothetical protein